MTDQINSTYSQRKPYSFGGKYRIYKYYPRKQVDEAMKKMTPIQNLNSTKRLETMYQSTYTENENYSSLMWFFSHDLKLLPKTMDLNICLRLLMCLLKWRGYTQ